MAEGDFNIKAIISAETSKFESGLKNAEKSIGSLSNSINGISSMLKTAFSVVGITASVGAIVNFGKKSVQAADEANKRFNILENTIIATGAASWTSAEEMNKAAKSYAKSTNYSVSEIEKMQSVLLGFRNITGDTFGEASDAILDMATVMGMDLTSAVQTVGKALDDPITGLDSLRRQGFAFTEEQKLELQQLVKNGEQLKAQKIILDELATTYGGAAKAGQSAFAQFQHSMDSFQEAIGNALMPSINNALKGMSKFMEQIEKGLSSKEFATVVAVLNNSFNALGNVLVKIGGYVSTAFGEIKNFISGIDPAPIKSLIDTLIGAVKSIFESGFGKAFEKGLEIIKSIKENLQNFLNSDAFSGIVEWLNAFVDGFVFLKNELDSIMWDIRESVMNALNSVWEIIKSVFNKSNEALANSETNIKSWSDFFWEFLDNVFRMFQDILYGIKALLQGDFSLAFDYAKLAALRWVDSLLTMFSTLTNAFPQVVQTVIDGINKIIEGINVVRDWLGQEKINLIEPFEKIDLSKSLGIEQQIAKIEKEIKDKTGKAADYSIKEIERVSVKFSGTFDNIVGDLTKTEKAAEKAGKKLKSSFTTNGVSGMDKIKAAFTSLKEQIEKDANDWSDVVSTSYNAIKDSASQMMTDLGKGLAEGSLSYEDFAATAVNAISQVLQALAAQLTAIAATKALAHSYGEAALAAGAAAAALVASGVLSGVANSMKSTAEESKKAAVEINAVTTAAKNSFTTLDDFVSKVKEIKENAEKGTISGLADEIIKSRKLYQQGTESLEKYKQAMELAYDNYVKMWQYYYNSVGQIDPGAAAAKATEMAEGYMEVLVYTVQQYDTYIRQVGNLRENIWSLVQQSSESVKEEVRNNELLVATYKEIYEAIDDYQKNLRKAESPYKDLLSFNLANTIDLREDLKHYYELALNEQKLYVQQLQLSLYEELESAGATIGNTFMSSFVNGATKNDFMIEIKNYFQSMLMRMSVLTEGFQTKLAELGVKIALSVNSGGEGLKEIRNEIEALWHTTKTKVTSVERIMSEVFGDIKDSVTETEESLTSFEEAMKSFVESIKDLGSQIADGIISGLENGLGQGDFLDSMKKWIRNLLIQTVVYTDAMKSEIEAIGKAISSGLTKGFTETSLHEIRRDLSYIFNEANKSMGSIDSVLNTVFGGYATGTQNAMAGLHLVGESGPELVRFKGGEQVLNAQNTQAALEGAGGNTNNFNVTFNNLQDTSAYAMMNQLREYNREMAINGVI